MRDVDRAAAEATLAIHEIIAPELVERLGEAGQSAIHDRTIVTLAPPLQGLCIIEAETFAILP